MVCLGLIGLTKVDHSFIDHGVTHLYRRIISPSLKNNNCEPNGWHHYRHSNMAPSYPGKNRLKAGSPDGKRGATPRAHLEQQIVHVPCSEVQLHYTFQVLPAGLFSNL